MASPIRASQSKRIDRGSADRVAASLRDTAAAVLLITGSLASNNADARGLLGLFAEEKITPEATPVAAPPESPDHSARPIAFVNSIRGVALPDLHQFDLVYPGQRIDLGDDGEIDLTFLSPCRTEIINGGTITIVPAGVDADAQSKLRTEAASCRPSDELPHPALKRGILPDEGPFLQKDWQEDVVNGRPVFKWGGMAHGSVATVSIQELDHPEPRTVWQIETPYPYVAYPAEAYTLIPGQPYLVTIETEGKQPLRGTFSVDLDLSFSRTALNQMVWLSDSGTDLE